MPLRVYAYILLVLSLVITFVSPLLGVPTLICATYSSSNPGCLSHTPLPLLLPHLGSGCVCLGLTALTRPRMEPSAPLGLPACLPA